jgi:hypothetical protein
MQHQRILPDLKEIVDRLPHDPRSSEYLLGAYEALMSLITDLDKKGY